MTKRGAQKSIDALKSAGVIERVGSAKGGYWILFPPGCTGMGVLLEDMGKELDPASYPVLSRLFARGLAGLLPYARELGYRLDPEGYMSKCELCFDIRKFLITTDRQGHPDLSPERLYSQDF